MTASRGSSGTGRREELARPDHLSVWLDGDYAHGTAPVPDDGRLVEGFTIPEWVDDIRLGYPSAVLAATFAGALASPSRDGAGSGAVIQDADTPDGPRSGDERPAMPQQWNVVMRRAAALVDRTTADLEDATSFRGDTTPTSLRSLRRWVMARLEGHPEVCDDAVLAVSELATNVERHAPSWLTVDIVVLDDGVLLGVTDPVVDQLPQPRSVSIDEPSGRGLLVVSTLSSAWGVVVRPESKTVWSMLPFERER